MWLSAQNVFWKLSPSPWSKKGRDETQAGDKARLALASDGTYGEGRREERVSPVLGQREISSIAAIIHEKWDSIKASETVPTEGKKQARQRNKLLRTLILN